MALSYNSSLWPRFLNIKKKTKKAITLNHWFTRFSKTFYCILVYYTHLLISTSLTSLYDLLPFWNPLWEYSTSYLMFIGKYTHVCMNTYLYVLHALTFFSLSAIKQSTCPLIHQLEYHDLQGPKNFNSLD